jgi:hypothetical protein
VEFLQRSEFMPDLNFAQTFTNKKYGAQTKHIGMKPIGMKPIATKPIGLKPIGY